jgi:aspartate/methionine/tyrosine aminotransferase
MRPFLVMEVLQRANEMEREGKSIIHLEVGEPDFPTPEHIKNAANEAIKKNFTGYTHSRGIPELREAISEYYDERYGVDVPESRIIITNGTSPAMLMIFSVIIKKGEKILLCNPYYPCYPNAIEFLGGVPNYSYGQEDDGFKLREIKKDEKTKAVLVNSPSNPSGAVLTRRELEKIVEESKNLTIVSDEIYHGISYEKDCHSILEFTEDAFVVDGFSKRYSMTGWRIGYIIAPEKYVKKLEIIHQNFFISTNSISQYAALMALRGDQKCVEEMIREFKRRRDFMFQRLNEIGLKVKKLPEGAFYMLANISEFSNDSVRFAYELLENTGVAVTPGIDFGDATRTHVRFSYANSMENIEEAMNRIEDYILSLNV